MKRLFAVIALSAALGLSTTAFTNGNKIADESCDASSDLSVTALLEDAEVGDAEIKGKIVNASDDNDYDEVMVRVEFLGESADVLDMELDGASDVDVDTDTDISDIDVDADIDVNRNDIDLDVDGDVERKTEVEVEGDSDLNSSSLRSSENVLHSQVYTINEDVEAGEVEEFALKLTPPAGTKQIRTTVVCAD